jgi:hypothetical protein
MEHNIRIRQVGHLLSFNFFFSFCGHLFYALFFFSPAAAAGDKIAKAEARIKEVCQSASAQSHFRLFFRNRWTSTRGIS